MRTIQQQTDEIKELRVELQDLKVAGMTKDDVMKKAKQRLKEAEDKAQKVPELEAQLATLKSSKSSSNAAMDKRSDEVDTLRAKNAELMRQLEELEGNGAHVSSANQYARATARCTTRRRRPTWRRSWRPRRTTTRRRRRSTRKLPPSATTSRARW
jgi:cell division septum initiation protein DivIVA